MTALMVFMMAMINDPCAAVPRWWMITARADCSHNKSIIAECHQPRYAFQAVKRAHPNDSARSDGRLISREIPRREAQRCNELSHCNDEL